MTRKSKAEKAIDAAINAAFREHGECIPFSILDLPKLWRDVRADFLSGEDINRAMIRAIGRYRTDKPAHG